MAITGMANLAVKVADLDAACAFYEAAGAEVRDVSVKHPTLEEVFIFLTGRHLR